MQAIPAIDIAQGRCVRLFQGDFGRSSDYGDPLEHARLLVEHGATRLHVVDLEGARAGSAVQKELVRSIARAFGGPLQVGGGVRTREAFEAYVALGAETEAAAACVSWRANEANARLDPSLTSPKIRAACSQK